jgi:single-stranded-DNA-specific exonuclease
VTDTDFSLRVSIGCSRTGCAHYFGRLRHSRRRGRDAGTGAGIDLIITDHHEPGAELPDALAVINPKRHDCTYPDKNLAGVGVALKLVQALCTCTGHANWLPAFVKVRRLERWRRVPLTGENRIIAKLGLGMLSRGPHKIGLRALLDVCGLTGREIDSYHIGFVVAPRVNAAGQDEYARHCRAPAACGRRDDGRGSASTGEQLDAENLAAGSRKKPTSCRRQGRSSKPTWEVGSRTVIVVAGEGWHRGVIGIVASKLVDAFHRPAIVISTVGALAHGSCRSIPSFNMLAALESCAELMSKFGGHKQAAGLTLETSRIRELRARVNDFADARLTPDDLRPRLWIDGSLTFRSINEQVVSELSTLAPFGAGNSLPVFRTSRVKSVDGPRRLKERHLKMAFKQDGRILRALPGARLT